MVTPVLFGWALTGVEMPDPEQVTLSPLAGVVFGKHCATASSQADKTIKNPAKTTGRMRSGMAALSQFLPDVQSYHGSQVITGKHK
jgi:hypothetical protein